MSLSIDLLERKALHLLKSESKSLKRDPDINDDDFTSFVKGDHTIYRMEKIYLCGKMQLVRKAYAFFGSYKVGWVLDSDVNFCMICFSNFGWTRRKHHCRACGFVICGKCSPYRAKVPGCTENISRVCNNCFGLKSQVPSPILQTSSADSFCFDSGASVYSETIRDERFDTMSVMNAANIAFRETRCEKIYRERLTKLENQELEKRRESYLFIRSIIPSDLQQTTIQDMIDNGLSPSLAYRLWHVKSLHLLNLSPGDIVKIHIADLRTRYNPQNPVYCTPSELGLPLDITELRALLYWLPDEKDWEGAGASKRDWYDNVKRQLEELAAKERKGLLTKHEVKNLAYQDMGGDDAVRLVTDKSYDQPQLDSDVPLISQLKQRSFSSSLLPTLSRQQLQSSNSASTPIVSSHLSKRSLSCKRLFPDSGNTNTSSHGHGHHHNTSQPPHPHKPAHSRAHSMSDGYHSGNDSDVSDLSGSHWNMTHARKEPLRTSFSGNQSRPTSWSSFKFPHAHSRSHSHSHSQSLTTERLQSLWEGSGHGSPAVEVDNDNDNDNESPMTTDAHSIATTLAEAEAEGSHDNRGNVICTSPSSMETRILGASYTTTSSKAAIALPLPGGELSSSSSYYQSRTPSPLSGELGNKGGGVGFQGTTVGVAVPGVWREEVDSDFEDAIDDSIKSDAMRLGGNGEGGGSGGGKGRRGASFESDYSDLLVAVEEEEVEVGGIASDIVGRGVYEQQQSSPSPLALYNADDLLTAIRAGRPEAVLLQLQAFRATRDTSASTATASASAPMMSPFPAEQTNELLLSCCENAEELVDALGTVRLLVVGMAADVNARDRDGKTPLFHTFHRPLLGEFLIASGADILSQDAAGDTPLSESLEYGYDWLVSYVEANGCLQRLDEVGLKRYGLALLKAGYGAKVLSLMTGMAVAGGSLAVSPLRLTAGEVREALAHFNGSFEAMPEPVEVFELLERYELTL